MFTKITLSLFSFLLILSFEIISKSDKRNVTGVYGVCNCDDSVSSSPLSLQINKDYTFEYRRTVNSKNTLEAKGTWTIDKNRIVLSNSSQNLTIPLSWKVSSQYPCIKARKNLEWIRLCACK